MGVREWPQQVKKGTWTETLSSNDSLLVRYVLEGQGSVDIVVASSSGDDTDDDGSATTTTTTTTTTTRAVQPGTLLQVTGPATLQWQATTADMIVLTPGYEQGGLLLAVGGGLVALLAGVIFATSS